MTKHNAIIAEIRRLASQLFANFQASVYLFGSRARGDAKEDSDWDLIIVADDSMPKKDAFEKFAFPFAEIGWRYGEQITPLLYTQSEWNAEKKYGILH